MSNSSSGGRSAEVFVGNLQPQSGSTLNTFGDRLVLRRADAAQLDLIDWKPPQ